ncbi:MAG: HD-GYP domain-containing protein [Bacilli bacterium]|nr:HD-GYP domain-containing protein [Bacilli bacterium]
MEESRKKIEKTAKILYIIAKVASIIVMISCVTVVVTGIFTLIFRDEMFEEFKNFLASEGVLDILENFGLDNLNEVAIVIGGMIVHAVSRIVIYIYLCIFEKVLKGIANGEQPYTNENARKLRNISFSFLVFIVINPFVAVVLLLVGLFLSHLISYGAYLNEKAEETKHIQESMIISFAEVVENKSEQTGQHVKRVAEYSKVIALELGYSEEEAEKIKLASMMHDIGKLLVPSEILEKPAKLTDEEFAEIKKHPGYGVKLLRDVDGDVLILAKRIAHEHHERFDGRGYPDGLGATNISMEGRIVAVADVYDALTSRRSYKEAWDSKKAYDEIVNNSGTQFDKDVVDAFIRAYDKIDEIRKTFIDE